MHTATPFVICSLTVFHYASPTPRAISETRFALQTFPSLVYARLSARPVLHRNRVAAGRLIRADRSQAAAVQQPDEDQVTPKKKKRETINKQQSADAEKQKSSGRCYVTMTCHSILAVPLFSLDLRSTLHDNLNQKLL